MTCIYCGNEVPDGMNFCPACGKQQTGVQRYHNAAAVWAQVFGFSLLLIALWASINWSVVMSFIMFGTISVAALILGILGAVYCKKNPGSPGKAYSIIGIVFGSIGILVCVQILFTAIIGARINALFSGVTSEQGSDEGQAETVESSKYDLQNMQSDGLQD